MDFFLNSYRLDNDCYHIFGHRSIKVPPPPPRGTPYNGLYRETPPETSTHSRLQVYERTGISLVEVYGRVKRWANRCTLWLGKSREKILVLPYIHNSKQVYLKGKGTFSFQNDI